MRENLALTLSPSVPRGGQGRGSQETGGGSQALRQFCLKPSPQKPSFSPTFPMELSQERRWVARGLQRLWKEGMHLENPAIKWKPSPTAPRSPASITSQLQNVGDGTGGGEPEQSPPAPVMLGRPCPTPIPGEGGRVGREPPGQASGEGVWWSPEAGREGRSCFPFGPPPTPAPTSGPRGLANRMEVGAGRTGSEHRHWARFGQAGWGGGGFALRRTPVSLGEAPGREAGEPPE